MRGSATQRGYGHQWQLLSAQVLDRDNRICHWCGGAADTADHLIPRRIGGTDDLTNLVAACRGCNSGRTPGDHRARAPNRGTRADPPQVVQR